MTASTDSPQSRLAASRKALVRQMSRNESRQQDSSHTGSRGFDTEQLDDTHLDSDKSGTWQVLTQAIMTWWKHHPVQVAVDVTRPFLDSYARDKPLQLLGMAAGVGAVAVLVKPWRLVSITGLAVAALRSTKLTTTLFSLLPLLPRRATKKSSPHTQQTMKDAL